MSARLWLEAGKAALKYGKGKLKEADKKKKVKAPKANKPKKKETSDKANPNNAPKKRVDILSGVKGSLLDVLKMRRKQADAQGMKAEKP